MKEKHRQQGWRKQSPPPPPSILEQTWVIRGNERFAAGNPAAVGMCSQVLSPGPAGSSVTTFLVAVHPLSSSEVKMSVEPKMSTYLHHKIKFKCNSTDVMILIRFYKVSCFCCCLLPDKKLLFINILLFEPPNPPLGESYVLLLCSLSMGPVNFKIVSTYK